MTPDRTFTPKTKGSVMKIVSWNAHEGNLDPRQVEDLIQTEDPDVICLQEVSTQLRRHLKSPYIRRRYPYSAFAIDHIMASIRGHTPAFLVILSRFPFEGKQTKYRHEKEQKRKLLSRVLGWRECIEHHEVNICVDGSIWKIINLHIACAVSLEEKLKQFHRAAGHFNVEGITIVCGDFNIIVTPEWWHLPRYAFRSLVDREHEIADMLLGDEQAIFAQRLVELGMHDPFRGQKTHPLSGLPLDKIIIPRPLVAQSTSWIIPHTFGSDHFPLVVKKET